MNIAGIQKMTLVDFPGHVAATIFTRGCSFRCPFCHNPELVVPEQFNPLLSEKQIMDFLESRYGKLTGICITGGEPCMQKDIDKFISYLKALGYAVKLDTNGSYPEKLAKIIKDGDVDYIAMDIKISPEKYPEIAMPNSTKKTVIPAKAGIQSSNCHPEPKAKDLVKRIKESIRLIMNSGIDYEFRTTVCHPLHEVEDFEEIGKMLQEICHSGPIPLLNKERLGEVSSKSTSTVISSHSEPSAGRIEEGEKSHQSGDAKKCVKRYFIQNYQHTKQVDEKSKFRPFSNEEIRTVEKIMRKYADEAKAR